jgi:hypothetical protein
MIQVVSSDSRPRLILLGCSGFVKLVFMVVEFEEQLLTSAELRELLLAVVELNELLLEDVEFKELLLTVVKFK